MTLKDRTGEFNSVAESLYLQKSGSNSKAPLIAASSFSKTKNTHRNARTQFAQIASQIGRDIAETTEKLERLTKLAKKKSLFDDPSLEIQELTAVINQDIKNLNNQISMLQQQKENQNRKNKQSENHSETVVDSLKSKLRTTTKGLAEILELRTENLKNQQKEREHFTGTSPVFARSGRSSDSPLYKAYVPESQTHEGGMGEVAIPMPTQSLALATQDRFLENRATAVANISRTIGELQGIFQQLASLVAEQQEMIQRIDSNIDNTAARVDSAQHELMKYLSSVSSNRALILKVFFVLIVFVILFIVFFV